MLRLVIATVLTVGTFVASGRACAEPVTAASRPNVLIIMCDQLNAGVLGCYGGPVPTPHIDRLAREGVRFDRRSARRRSARPRRASIITGLYPHAHGIVTNVNRRDYPAMPSPATEEGIKAADVTTEKLLHAAGYATHHYGKWHLLGRRPALLPDMYGEHHEYAAEMADAFAGRAAARAADAGWTGTAGPCRSSSRPPFRAGDQKAGRAAGPAERLGRVRHARWAG